MRAAPSSTAESCRACPSTVLDLSGAEPVVLREGAVPSAEALALVAAVRGA